MNSRTAVADAPPDTADLRRSTGRRLGWLLALTVGVVVMCAASIAFGTRDVSIGEIFSAFSGGTGVGEAVVATRIPRTVLGLLVGAALAMAGLTMQERCRKLQFRSMTLARSGSSITSGFSESRAAPSFFSSSEMAK